MLSEEENKAIKECDIIFMCLDDAMSEDSANDYRKSYKILKNLIEKQSKEIDKLKEIVDECIPKKENIITRELEYTPNANANSYLTQEILLLLKEE